MKKKFLIFIPAYNVEKKILDVLNRIPKEIFNDHLTSILIIDDFSKDNTRSVIKKYLETKSEDSSIQLIVNEKNFGYGGVQKIAFKYAIKNNFDYVIMLHGDGQYAPEYLPKAFEPQVLLRTWATGRPCQKTLNRTNATCT